MSKYIKKSAVVDAVQFTDANKDAVYNWALSDGYRVIRSRDIEGTPTMEIHTPIKASPHRRTTCWLSDYLVRNENGEFCAYTPDIFKRDYKLLHEEENEVEEESNDSAGTGYAVTVGIDTSEIDRAKVNIQELISLLKYAVKLKEKLDVTNYETITPRLLNPLKLKDYIKRMTPPNPPAGKPRPLRDRCDAQGRSYVEVVKKLAEYEDTGYTPEEINTLARYALYGTNRE